MADAKDPFDLRRFATAQEPAWADIAAELRAGSKRTHWMWFVFPQLDGLGQSTMARLYALRGLAEARAYHAHPLLGARLRDSFGWVLASGRSAAQVFPAPDDLKFRSCATLFAAAVPAEPLYERALREVCAGERDERTLELLQAAGAWRTDGV